ncbi:restriction endonuclease subunit S [Aeromonas media]|uniref:restriction endonuclease subunit S n=1 Tax=Aeromonas media TaxID=651 RepID=UPI0029D8E60A|nr:restriction endonuclease subunit S [Aeromonas media]MDX7900642.1 restriction endonuclease subunit S [Aeromonas media]
MVGFDLPEEWCLTKIGDVCSKITDGSHNPPRASTEGLPMLSAKNIHNGIVDFNLEHRLIPHDDFFIEDKRTNIQANDVLLTIVGALGRTALVVKDYTKFTLQRSVAVLAAPHLDAKCFRYSLEEYQFQKQITDNAKGTAQKGIYLKKLSELTLPIPPLAEQKEIADRLDKLLAQVEATQARLANIPHIIKQFRQSILAAAVSGKLTKEWRGKNKNNQAHIKHNSKLPYLTENEYYLDSIEGWTWLRLGSVVDLINGDRGKNYPNKNEYVEHGVPFINTGHIEPDGTLSDKRMNFISEAKYNSLGGGKTQPTDLVYCLRGATMGKTARVHYDVGAIASSLVIVRPKKYLERDFAYYFLISPAAKELISKFDNGSAQPNLSAKSLATYPLQLPPLEEQTEIVRRVEQLFAYADTIEQQAKAAKERVDKLTQAILAKAFRGELTADWRATNPELISGDNSAAALLARIQAERAAVKPRKSRRV